VAPFQRTARPPGYRSRRAGLLAAEQIFARLAERGV
jgi:hypothetical protein